MHTHSLFELNEHIRQVLALNFPQPVWIAAEVAQVGQSRGHYYLDLVQKEAGNDVVAQAQAVLWAAQFRQINARFDLGLLPLLREGLELRLQVRPEFHERYGLKLNITDVDPAHTLGQLDLMRRKTIQTLREKGLWGLNQAIPAPEVLQRVAVISSETAAGLQDFRAHLEHNSYGYKFDCQYFSAAVQGKNAETEIIAALLQIKARSAEFDCVVLVRGGGARLDLMAFDGLMLCETAAQMPLPLLVGIGHDVDESVLDLVAYASLKTPTAVADYLVNHNLIFEGKVLEAAELMESFTRNLLKIKDLELGRLETTLDLLVRSRLREETTQLAFLAAQIPKTATQFLREQNQSLESIAVLCTQLDPMRVLERGYSITRKKGKAIRQSEVLKAGDEIETQFATGWVSSQVL